MAVEVSDCSLYVEQGDSIWADSMTVPCKWGSWTCWSDVGSKWCACDCAYAWRIDPAGGGLPHGLEEWDTVWTWRLHYWSACRVLSSLSIQVPLTATHFQNDGNQWKWLNDPIQLKHYELPWHGGSIFLDYGPLSDVLTTRGATYPPPG